MKLKFKRQEFQEKAVNAVADLFIGQKIQPSVFSIVLTDFFNLSAAGYGNTLTLSKEQIEKNMHLVQSRNMLPLTKLEELRFNIEMETGTGKTFVYTKTIYELNKRYGWKKFVILVPSKAIREGVYKSLSITKEYFAKEYNGTIVNPFIYNSSRLYEVRDFAQSTNLEIMIINIDAFNKSKNLFNQENDRLSKPAAEFIKECRPILIIDEPQSVDNTDKAREAIKNLNPLFELRYSATHKTKINTIFRLSPVDAYQQGLVKQICVANSEVVDDYNKPYIRLISCDNSNGFFARLELDVADKKSKIVTRKIVKVKPGTDLAEVTSREIYQGYVVAGINCESGFEEVEFSNTQTVTKNSHLGSIDEMLLKRELIRRTIEIHLQKELRYIKRGIKILSLFFIDEVAKYRDYNSPDQKGVYAKIFEEEYSRLIEQDRFKEIKSFFNQPADKVHDGYFAKDKKGRVKDTSGDTADDENVYQLIMRDKEKLLSFDCPLRFIFSHSALKEGWDNPNVFQICTLIESKTPFTCRQKIGRGLRLCVNQDGERVEDKNINILHVIAKESFAEFLSTLQKEIEEETGIKFGVLDIGMFVDMSYLDENEKEQKITYDDSASLLDFFRSKNYIDKDNKIQISLKNDLQQNSIELPKKFEPLRQRIINQLQQAAKKVEIKSEKKQVYVKRKDWVFEDERFIALWNKIKQKTIYRINLDIDAFMKRCIESIAHMMPIEKAKIKKQTAIIDIRKEGVDYKEQGIRYTDIEQSVQLPDVVRIISTATKLPRSNVAKILIESNRLNDFINNPQKYIEQVIYYINYHKSTMSIDGIKYTKVEGQEYSYMDVFNTEDTREIIAYLDSNALPVDKSVYDYVIYDSETVEKPFAEALDNDEDVKLFFKIPKRFTIDTPVGSYTP